MRRTRLAPALALLALALLCLPLAPAAPAGAQSDPAPPELYGHFGGVIGALAARPPYLFIGAGNAVEVLDERLPNTGARLGALPLPRTVVGLAPAGDYLYTLGAGRHLGDPNLLMTVDVRDPARPLLAAELEVEGSPGIREIFVADGALYLLGVRLHIFSLASPAAPVEVAEVDLPVSNAEIAVAGSYAYLAVPGESIRVLDLRNPAAPQEVGRFTPATGKGFGDLVVAGGRLYAYSSDPDGTTLLRVFGLASPAAPERLHTHNAVGAGGRLAGDGERVALYTEPGAGERLAIYDPRGPAEAPPASSGPAPAGVGRLALAGARAALAADYELSVYTLSPGQAPAAAGGYRSTGVDLIAVDGARAAAVTYSSAADRYDLRLIDIADPQAPALLAAAPGVARVGDLDMAGDLIAVSAQQEGLALFRAGAGITRLGAYDPAGAVVAAELRGGLAYLLEQGAGLRVVDVADPSAPALRGSAPITGTLGSLWVAGGRAFVTRCDASGLSGRLQIVGLADPAAPAVIGGVDTSCPAQVASDTDGDTLYLYEGQCLTFLSCRTRLRVLDVGNPAAPQERGSLDGLVGSPGAIAVGGGHVALITYESARLYEATWLYLIDVRNPAAPARAGLLRLPHASGLSIAGPLLYTGGDGLNILRAERLFQPSERLYLPQLAR